MIIYSNTIILFRSLFSATLFFIFLLFVFSLFEMVPRRSSEALFGVAKLKKAATCLKEQTQVTNKPCSGTSHRAVPMLSTLRVRQCGTSTKRGNFTDLYARPLSANAASTVCDEPTEKMEKGSKFVDSETVKEEKGHIGYTVRRLKAEGIFRRIYPGSGNR